MKRDRWVHPVQIVLFVIALMMTITLLVFWNVYLVSDYGRIRDLMGKEWTDQTRWWVLSFGSFFFSFIIVVISFFFAGFVRRSKFARTQSDFVNLTTHELKLPLANIRMFVQTLLKRNLSSEQIREFVQHIGSESDSLTSRLDRLLETRKIEQGKLAFTIRKMDFSEYLQDYCENFDGKIDFEIPKDIWVRMDSYYMDHVLNNIFGNIQKYAQGSTPILKVWKEAKFVNVEISDQGKGVLAKDRAKIFDRFYRSEKEENSNISGTGLGLYIVRKIIEQHGGHVSARNLDEGGLCIAMRFKLAKEGE